MFIAEQGYTPDAAVPIIVSESHYDDRCYDKAMELHVDVIAYSAILLNVTSDPSARPDIQVYLKYYIYGDFAHHQKFIIWDGKLPKFLNEHRSQIYNRGVVEEWITKTLREHL